MKKYQATAVDTRMVTTFRTDDGREFVLSTNLPKGTVVDVYAEALTSSGGLIGYDGFEVIVRPKKPSLADAADLATQFSALDYSPHFEEVLV